MSDFTVGGKELAAMLSAAATMTADPLLPSLAVVMFDTLASGDLAVMATDRYRILASATPAEYMDDDRPAFALSVADAKVLAAKAKASPTVRLVCEDGTVTAFGAIKGVDWRIGVPESPDFDPNMPVNLRRLIAGADASMRGGAAFQAGYTESVGKAARVMGFRRVELFGASEARGTRPTWFSFADPDPRKGSGSLTGGVLVMPLRLPSGEADKSPEMGFWA